MNLTLQRGAFDARYRYEIVLLILGVVLFFVTLWAIVRAVRRDRCLWGPLPLLLFVVVFIGYPNVQAVQLSQAADEVTKLATSADTPAPMSAHAQQRATAQIALVAKRPGTTNKLAVVANAYRAVGQTDAALATARKVDASNPPPAIAHALAPIYETRSKQTVDMPVAGRAPVGGERAAQIRAPAQRIETARATTSADTDPTLAKAHESWATTKRRARKSTRPGARSPASASILSSRRRSRPSTPTRGKCPPDHVG